MRVLMTCCCVLGLVLPPRVASVQVVVIPCGITAKSSVEDEQRIMDAVTKLVQTLKAGNIRASADVRQNYTPGWKYNHWELKGVPLRVEVGPKDLEKAEVRVVRRDTGTKTQLPVHNLCDALKGLLDTIHNDMFRAAKKDLDAHTVVMMSWEDVVPTMDAKCMVYMPWCERVECEKSIKERTTRK